MEYVKFSKFIVSTQYGYTAEETSLVGGDARYLRITDIVPYFVNKEQVPFCKIDDNKKKKYLINENDLLIARTGATTGYNLVVDESYKNFVFASYLIRFNYNKNELYPLYLKYVLKSQQWYGFVNNFISGSAQPGMNAKVFGKFQIPFFNYDIQKRISNILSTYDKLIDNNNKRIKLLEQMTENIYKEWFVRFRFPGYEDVELENRIPKGWEVKKIKNCVKRLPFKKLYKQNELELEGKVIVIDQSSAEFLGYHNDEPSHCASIDKPVLLFGDHSCKFVLMIRDFSLGENMVPFISGNENKLNDYYLFYAVHKIIVTEEYKRHWGRFMAMKILVPKYELQLAFANFIKPIIHEQNKLWNENQLLTKQRDMLLPRLMSGKLKV